MGSLAVQNDLGNFLREPENAQGLNGLVEDVRYALIDYQVCTFDRLALNASNLPQTSLQQEIYDKHCQEIVSVGSHGLAFYSNL